jgi:hypothetical protein
MVKLPKVEQYLIHRASLKTLHPDPSYNRANSNDISQRKVPGGKTIEGLDLDQVQNLIRTKWKALISIWQKEKPLQFLKSLSRSRHLPKCLSKIINEINIFNRFLAA